MAEKKPFTGVNDRVKLRDVIPLKTPFTLNIFPSNICNFRCNYCAQSLGGQYLLKEYDFPLEIMKMETLEKAVEQAKAFEKKFKLVSFMGHGEPLCNRRLPEMIQKVKSADIAERVDIITNASLLTKEYTDELIEAGLDVLRVSLQGVSSESYSRICNADIDFNGFVENLAYFYHHKKQCKIYVKTVDAALGEGEEEKFYQIFSEISDRIYVDKVKPVYAGVEYSEQERDLSQDRYGNPHNKRYVCPQPFYMMSVWQNGDVTPCDALYKAGMLGNINDRSLKEMWESKEHTKFCRLHLEKKKDMHSSCTKCCAPDDVACEEDILDDAAEQLKEYFE